MRRLPSFTLCLLAAALMIAAAAAASSDNIAAIATEVVIIQNCSCSGNGCVTHYPPSGNCSVDPHNPANNGRVIQCMDQQQQCAQLVNFNDPACTSFSGVFTAVCGTCQKLNDNPLYYARANCDSVTQQVSWDINCNSGCSQCFTKNVYLHPFDQCTGGLGGNGYTYNQGIMSCDAVNITVYASPTCNVHSTKLDQFVVGQYSCNFGEYMACSPKNPQITPNPGQAVVQTFCFGGWGGHGHAPQQQNLGCINCPQFLFATGSCQPAPPFMTQNGILSHDATCSGSQGMCADLVIHNNTVCSSILGRSTPVCGSCMMFEGESNFTKINCNYTSYDVTISKGCDPMCNVCAQPAYVTHKFLECGLGFINTTTVFNRGLFPCSTVQYNHYSSINCAPNTLVNTVQEAEGICQIDRMAQCVDRLVTIENCSDATAPAVVVQEDTCVEDAFGFYRKYHCMNRAPTCAQLVQFTDSGCMNFKQAGSFVCGSCNKIVDPFTFDVTYQYFSCNPSNQAVSISINCNQNCSACANPNALVHPAAQCSRGLDGLFIRNEGVSPCDAVQVTVYNSSTCAQAQNVGNYSLSQNMCSFDEFIQCTADILPPAVSQGSALVVNECSDMHCSASCHSTAFTAGGCMENFQGRPGSHVVSCDSYDSHCADLSVHSGRNCGNFLGVFHPVCGQCSAWFNDTDPFGYTLIQCDPMHPNVTISTMCNQGCTVCQNPAQIIHPFLQCSPDTLHPQWSIINRGIIPCSTVSVTEYRGQGCMGGSRVNSWQIARDFCDMGRTTTCAHQSIGIQNCSACMTQGGNSAACNKSYVQEGACVADPYTVGGMRTVSCVATWQRCVHLAIFSDSACSPSTYRTSVSAVCNQCNQIIEVNASGFRKIVYAKLNCNEQYNWVGFQTHCNADCSICNSSDSTLMVDHCNPTNYLGGVYSQGITLCDAVQISQYPTPRCTGTPTATYMVGQHQCTFDEYYECAARPLSEPVPFNGKVTMRQCAHGDFACMNCNASSFASGACVPAPRFKSQQVFCSFGATSTCAYLDMHNGTNCTSYMGVHTPVCNSCVPSFENDGTWMQVLCDPVSQQVTVQRYCDTGCATCLASDVHPYLTCNSMNSTYMSGLMVLNRGLMPCDVATVLVFEGPSCDMSMLEGNYQIAQSTCQFDHALMCEPHLVHVQECDCPTCTETVLVEGECTQDAEGYYRRYSCSNVDQSCATWLVYPSTTTCGESGSNGVSPIYNNTRPVVMSAPCGSCFHQPNQSSGGLEYMFLDCDYNSQNIYLSKGCDNNCQICTQPKVEEHPFMECSSIPTNAQGFFGSAFNQGLRPCNSLTVKIYNNSACSGSSLVKYQAGQRNCQEEDHLYIYCDANPPPQPPPGGQILMTMCPWQSGPQAMKRVQEGDCTTGCQTFPVPDGTCAPPPPGETRYQSHRVTCDTQSVSMCADIILFNGTGATGCVPANFVGIHTPVCGSCYQFGMDTTYTQVVCDLQYQYVTFNTQCNSDCSVCTNMGETIDMLVCDAALHPGFSLVSRGLFSCPTVTFTHYSSTDCAPGTSIATVVQAQGICEFDHKFQCAVNMVTVQNCSCPSCPATIAAENNCVADAFGMYRQYSCANYASECVNFAWYTDDACDQYQGAFSAVCNTCQKQIDPFTQEVMYSQIYCNMTSQAVIISTGCSDDSCNDCIGQQYVHPFNSCSNFMRGSSLYNTGVVPCDAVTISVFQDSACVSQPVDSWTQSQHVCTGGIDEYMSCTAAPSVNVNVAQQNAVNFYYCPANSIGCMDCTIDQQISGGCYATPYPGHYHVASCDSQMNFCVDFALHNNAQCTAGYQGTHNPVCGTCSRWFNETTYTKVHCDVFSQNVTMSFQCNADCSVCGEVVTHGFMQCSQLITQPTRFLYNRGIMPCSTVTLTEFTSSDCSPSSVIGTYQVPQDLCTWGGKIQCIHVDMPPVGPTQGEPASSGVGVAVGVTAGVLIAAFVGAAAVYKYRQRRVYRTVDPQWSAMNEQGNSGGAATPSNLHSAYGAVNE